MITTFILMTLFLIEENNNSPLPLSLFLSILFLFLLGYQLHHRIISRKRNLWILLGGSFVIGLGLIHLVGHGIFNTTLPTSHPDNYYDGKIITLNELLPQQPVKEIDPYFDFQSSFLIPESYTYSNYDREYYSYQSYQLRSSFFGDYLMQLLLKEYNHYNRYTELNPNLASSYLIYKHNTNQVSGITLTQGLITYVIESVEVDFNDSTMLNHLLQLLSK